MILKNVRRFISRRIGREYRIRWRLWRASLAADACRADRAADVFLISYPKCGRTWLRMLLSRALTLHVGAEDVDYLASDILDGSDAGMPHIRVSHDDNPHWKRASQLEQSKRQFRGKRVVLLIRDPRDVVVSMFFERSRREKAYAGTLHDFLHEPKGSLQTILAYYNVWSAARTELENVHIVRYEDLQADTAGELRGLLDFVGLANVSSGHVEQAVAFASFDSMRQMETSGTMKSGRLRARDSSDVESFKTRRGKVGGYVDYLSPEEISWMEAEIASTLDPCFGYNQVATPQIPVCDVSASSTAALRTEDLA